jgi:hypothetical protein
MNKLSLGGRIAILALLTALTGGVALAVNYNDSTPVQGAQPKGSGVVTNPFLMGVQAPDGSVQPLQGNASGVPLVDPSGVTAPVRPTDVVITGIGPSACAAGLDGGTVAIDPSLPYRMFTTGSGCLNLSGPVTSCTQGSIATPSTVIRFGDHQGEPWSAEGATPVPSDGGIDGGPSDAAVYYIAGEGSGTTCVQFKLMRPK